MVGVDRTWIERSCAGLWCLTWLGIAALMLMRVSTTVQVSHFDLLVHAGVFGTMSLATVSFARDASRLMLLALVTVAGATALEVAQALVPYRSFELLDLAANVVGAAGGYGLASLIRGRLSRSPGGLPSDAAGRPAPSPGRGVPSRVGLGAAIAGSGPRVRPAARQGGERR